jgi:hypothetical protein
LNALPDVLENVFVVSEDLGEECRIGVVFVPQKVFCCRDGFACFVRVGNLRLYRFHEIRVGVLFRGNLHNREGEVREIGRFDVTADDIEINPNADNSTDNNTNN